MQYDASSGLAYQFLGVRYPNDSNDTGAWAELCLGLSVWCFPPAGKTVAIVTIGGA